MFSRLAIACAISCLPISAMAAKPVVGIVPHPVVNVDDAERDQIAQQIGTALARHYNVSISKTAAPRDLPDDCVGQPACFQDVGKKMGADQLLFLVMVRVGPRVQIDPTWVDVSSGRTSTRDPISLETGGKNRGETFRDAAPSLIPRGSAQTIGETTPPVASKPPGTKPPGSKPDPWRDGGDNTADPSSGEVAKPIPTGVWIATGVAGVALFAGVALMVGGTGDYSDFFENRCHLSEDACGDDVSRYRTRSVVANILLAGAAAAGATAIMLYVSAGEDTQTSVAVFATPNGLAVGGAF